MRIRIEGVDMPGRFCGPGPDYPDGHHNVHVAVQARNKPRVLLGMVRGDTPAPTWTLDADDADLGGPYIQGPAGARFIYLSWGVVDEGEFTMFRRAKIWLDDVPPAVLRRAKKEGVLVGRVGLTDDDGWPRCASVRQPLIAWSTSRNR